MTPFSFPSRYKILHELGRGGMGSVYWAQRKWTGSFRAIKTVLQESTKDKKEIERLWTEAKRGRYLRHPNIVRVHDCIIEPDALFIEMEYVEGDNLKNILSYTYKTNPAPAVQIFIDVCSALEYAYYKAKDKQQKKLMNLYHRDVSPSNILISRKGKVKLSDFGIAKDAQEASDGIAGKLRYMAPEAMNGEPCHESDVYACGVILFEMIIGLHPFDLFNARGRFVQPKEIDPTLPESLNTAICIALNENPNKRPNAKDFRIQLQKIQKELGKSKGNSVLDMWNEYHEDVKNSFQDQVNPDQNNNAESDHPEETKELTWFAREDKGVFLWPRRIKVLIPVFFALVIGLFTLGFTFLGKWIVTPTLGPAFDFHAIYAANDGEKGGIFLANPDGSARIKLAYLGLGERALNLSPTPDGEMAFFAYINRIGRGALASIDQKGKIRRLAPETLSEDRYLGGSGGTAVSPDGKWILLSSDMRNLNGWGELFLAKTDWKPNLKKMTYAITHNDSLETFRDHMNEIGFKLLTLREEVGTVGQFVWSPDSQKICFESADQAFEPSRLWVMNRDGSDKRIIHQCHIHSTALAWSKKNWITFTDGKSQENSDIFIIKPDGSGLDLLAATPGQDSFKEFDPNVWKFDGTGLVFQSNQNNNYDIFEVFLSDRYMGQLTTNTADEVDASWALKGHEIFYVRSTDNTLWRTSAQSRENDRLVNAAGEKIMGYSLLKRP